jgi:hypothetical protein
MEDAIIKKAVIMFIIPEMACRTIKTLYLACHYYYN